MPVEEGTMCNASPGSISYNDIDSQKRFPEETGNMEVPVPVTLGTKSEEASNTVTPELASLPNSFDLRAEQLKALLIELKIPQFSSYEKVLPKLMYDPRFTSVPKEDRRTIFNHARRKLLYEEQARKSKHEKEALSNFEEFLNDLLKLGRIHSDSTLESLEKKHSHSSLWPRNVDRNLLEKKVTEIVKKRNENRLEAVATFTKLVKDIIIKFHLEKSESLCRWSQFEKEVASNPAYEAIHRKEEKKKIYYDVLRQCMDEYSQRIREKKVSRSDSYFGTKTVKRSRNSDETGVFDGFESSSAIKRQSVNQDSRESHKKRILREEALQQFRLILVEKIKNPFSLSYSQAIKLLSRDPRISSVSRRLDSSEKRAAYDKFVQDLKKDRLKLLESELARSHVLKNPQVTFEEASKLLQWTEDKRFKGLPTQDVKVSFYRWRNTVVDECKFTFVNFLKTSVAVSADVPETGPLFDKLTGILEKDERFTKLDGFPELRKELIQHRLRELSRQTRRQILDIETSSLTI